MVDTVIRNPYYIDLTKSTHPGWEQHAKDLNRNLTQLFINGISLEQIIIQLGIATAEDMRADKADKDKEVTFIKTQQHVDQILSYICSEIQPKLTDEQEKKFKAFMISNLHQGGLLHALRTNLNEEAVKHNYGVPATEGHYNPYHRVDIKTRANGVTIVETMLVDKISVVMEEECLPVQEYDYLVKAKAVYEVNVPADLNTPIQPQVTDTVFHATNERAAEVLGLRTRNRPQVADAKPVVTQEVFTSPWQRLANWIKENPWKAAACTIGALVVGGAIGTGIGLAVAAAGLITTAILVKVAAIAAGTAVVTSAVSLPVAAKVGSNNKLSSEARAALRLAGGNTVEAREGLKRSATTSAAVDDIKEEPTERDKLMADASVAKESTPAVGANLTEQELQEAQRPRSTSMRAGIN